MKQDETFMPQEIAARDALVSFIRVFTPHNDDRYMREMHEHIDTFASAVRAASLPQVQNGIDYLNATLDASRKEIYRLDEENKRLQIQVDALDQAFTDGWDAAQESAQVTGVGLREAHTKWQQQRGRQP